jgi:hypothetical protein
MNAVLGATVDSLVDSRIHRIVSRIDLTKTFLYWRPDGFFTDSFDPVEWTHVRPAYVPLAYHVYTAALLHRYWTVTGSKIILTAFKRAVRSLAAVIPKNGHIAYRGRSAGHIFTYGVSVYVFLAAAVEMDAITYLEKAECILKILEYLQDSRGRFPVVANENAYDDIIGCQANYAYHSVYNAHCTAWLARTLDLPEVAVDSLTKSPEVERMQKYRWAGLYDYRFSKYHAVISTGRGGCYDAALSIAMLDNEGALASLPAGDGETELTGHTVGYFTGDNLAWSSTRTSGKVNTATIRKLSGHVEYATPVGAVTEERRFKFEPKSIHVHSRFSGTLDTHLDGDNRFEYRFSSPDDAPVNISFDRPSSQTSVCTVLGDGNAKGVTFRPRDLPLSVILTLSFD